MYYPLFKEILFRLNPEVAHAFTLKTLSICERLNIIKEFIPIISAPRQVMGLTFLNPVGLAAGLDKNGEYIDALAALGFGFIEVGTITRKPQIGNPKPRLFRLINQNAIINRMGFNNKGVDYMVERLKKTKYTGVLGINIGKNKETPLENAVDDYTYLFRRVAPYASYITINISSPNTEGLRSLQHGEMLRSLLQAVKKEQAIFLASAKRYVPLAVKIAPDLTEEELADITKIFLEEHIDGVIATNTTLSRVGVEDSEYATEQGGLSGKPLREKATHVVSRLSHLLQNRIPIIGCGGVDSGNAAKEKISAGASLVQIYTGLIYQGAGLVEECVKMNS